MHLHRPDPFTGTVKVMVERSKGNVYVGVAGAGALLTGMMWGVTTFSWCNSVPIHPAEDAAHRTSSIARQVFICLLKNPTKRDEYGFKEDP